ncbi:MAG: glutaredoxin family protein [Pseudomonadota bacterium]
MKTIFLYGTEYCHLCEQAEELLRNLSDPHIRIEKVDISEDDELMERYSLRIPVVRLEHNTNDLGWPFDSCGLQEYLEGS